MPTGKLMSSSDTCFLSWPSYYNTGTLNLNTQSLLLYPDLIFLSKRIRDLQYKNDCVFIKQTIILFASKI